MASYLQPCLLILSTYGYLCTDIEDNLSKEVLLINEVNNNFSWIVACPLFGGDRYSSVPHSGHLVDLHNSGHLVDFQDLDSSLSPVEQWA